MNHPESTAARLASEAMMFAPAEREAFIRKRCEGDSDLVALAIQLMSDLVEADRSNAEMFQTAEPLATIDSFSKLSSVAGDQGTAKPDTAKPDTVDAKVDEEDDALATFFSHGSVRSEATSRGELTKKDVAVENVGNVASTMDPAMTMDVISDRAAGLTDDASFAIGGDATLSPDLVSEVSAVCERFLSAWNGGAEPRLVDFIPKTGDSVEREYIAFQLVVIDVQQRQQRNRPISEQAYFSQIPDCRNAIQSALTKRSSPSPQAKGKEKPTVLPGKSGTQPGSNNDKPGSSIRTGDIRYQPVKMHAKGGLGAVYRAKDMELSRTVALKRILPAHEDNLNSRARFVFEAEVTGSLEHPGIVPVYGLGTYGEGQPYYAMRFIRGESFSDAIARFHKVSKKSRERLPAKADSDKAVDDQAKSSKPELDFYGREFRQLLRRLIDTCNAMHYAHERGVLHRDLKPDNVMLGQYGETLVVDWGLAKLMSSDAKQPSYDDVAAEPLTVTDSGLRTTIGQAIGTPMYMSSEQALGLHDELTPASDVYSLGGMLFNMISGQHPIEGKSTRDIIINVRNGKTKNLLDVLPSAPKALGSICRKAMMKEPQDRYQTATEFAEDIDRWLSDEQVLAHADAESVAEKAGRLIRRYRGWTVSGAVALLAITIVSIIASLLINQAKEAEKVAKVRAKEFKGEAVQRYHESREAIDTWLVQSNDALQFFPGTQAVRQRLLTVAAEDYAKLSSTKSEDPDLELERGRTLIRLGDLSQMREDSVGAKKHYQEAITVFERKPSAARTRDTNIVDIDWLYAAEAANAKSRLAIALVNENALDEADKLYSEAKELLATVHQHFDDPLMLRYRASTAINHGELFVMQKRFQDAEEKFVAGLKLFTDLGDLATQKDVLSKSRAEELLGRLLGQLGQNEAAMDHFLSAVKQLQPLVESNRDHPEYLDALASVFISQASVHRVQGQVNLERISLSEAVERYRALVTALPDLPRYSENLSASLTDLGLLLLESDRCTAAKPVLVEASELLVGLAKRYGNPPYYQSQLATNQDALGQVLWNLGEFGEAQQAFVQALQGFGELNLVHPEIADYSERFSIVKSHLSRTVEGEDADEGFRSAAATLEKLVTEFPDVPGYASGLGYVYLYHGWKRHTDDAAVARELFAKARDTWVGMGASRDPKTSERLAWLLTICPVDEIRDFDQAKKFASEALSKTPDSDHYRSTLALAMSLGGEVEEAEALFLNSPLNSLDRDGRHLLTLAALAAKAGNVERAKEYRDQGIQWMNEHAPNSDDLLLLSELSSN